MNNISWFVYGVQIADNVGNVLVGLMVLAVAAVIPTIIQYFARWPTYSSEDHSDANKAAITSFTRKALTYEAAAFIICAAFIVVLPSRQTLLLIAGSEMGERALKSDAVQDIINPGADLLKSWIKEETERLNSKKKT